MAQHGWGYLLDRVGKDLGLTTTEKSSIQPIVAQTRSQLMAIHQQAQVQGKADVEAALVQIRPLLTPAQQTKLDAIVKAYEDLQAAEQELDKALQ
jgi:ACT domain-containing protein